MLVVELVLQVEILSYLFGAGVVGIEYNFDIPLLISLDFRPEIGFSDIYDGLNSDIALSLRYQF